MDSMDNFRIRLEALVQQTKAMEAHTRTVARRLRWWRGITCCVVLLGLLSLAPPSAQAATFLCAAGDVTCLIDRINEANANGQANTIILEAGTYTLPGVNNTTDGNNGLPSITSTLTIQGQGPGQGIDATILEGQAGFAVGFRLVHVAAMGTLTLEGLTLRKGGGGFVAGNPMVNGGGLLNQGGTVAIANTLFTDNAGNDGGGLQNNGGTATIARSMFVRNIARLVAGGGVSNPSGTMTITETTFSDNAVQAAGGGGALRNGGTVILTDSSLVDNTVSGGVLSNSGTAILTNTTIGPNIRDPEPQLPGALVNRGTVILTNSTVADNNSNSTVPDRTASGLMNSSDGTAILTNTILARNDSDCDGRVTSLGHNLIGEIPTDCMIILQPTDLTGDPGLGPFEDDGTPGNGHFPLLRDSPAIGAGNDAFCPPTDQLGEPRVGRCDIGAIEFQGRPDGSQT
jgi:hypothetical protein